MRLLHGKGGDCGSDRGAVVERGRLRARSLTSSSSNARWMAGGSSTSLKLGSFPPLEPNIIECASEPALDADPHPLALQSIAGLAPLSYMKDRPACRAHQERGPVGCPCPGRKYGHSARWVLSRRSKLSILSPIRSSNWDCRAVD